MQVAVVVNFWVYFAVWESTPHLLVQSTPAGLFVVLVAVFAVAVLDDFAVVGKAPPPHRTLDVAAFWEVSFAVQTRLQSCFRENHLTAAVVALLVAVGDATPFSGK
jgi:hypothetical protein